MQTDGELKEEASDPAPTAILRVGPDEEFETIQGAAATHERPNLHALPCLRESLSRPRTPLAHGSRDRTMHGW